MGGRDDIRAKKKAYEDHRRNVEAQEAAERRRWTADEWAKAGAGAAGYIAGALAGVPRGAVHTVRDLGAGLDFATRLVDPFDPLVSAPGQSAWEEAGRGVADGARHLADRAQHPHMLLDEVQSGAQQLGRDVNPAPGFAPTAWEQFKSDFHQGANAGEAAFNTATLAAGGPELKTLRELGYLGKAPSVATRIAQSALPREAAYLDGLYDPRGMGSHGFIPRSATLPGGAPIPKWFMDSKWNRTMPAPGATKGQMFQYHYAIDPSYNGGRISRGYGAGGWSGARLGWTKDGPLERRWRGIPLRTKAAAYGALAGLGGVYIPAGVSRRK